MPSRKPTREQLQQARDLMAIHGSPFFVEKATGIPDSTIRNRHAEACRQGIDISPEVMAKIDDDKDTKIAALKDQVRSLRAQVRDQEAKTVTYDTVRAWVGSLGATEPDPPQWLTKGRKHKSLTGVPTLLLSDWHWGEVVKPSEIGGANTFNLEIARERAHRMVDSAKALLFDHMAHPEYDGLVLPLGGDMVSGDIHEELSKTNDAPIMPVVCDCIDVIDGVIKAMLDSFERIYVPCVTGNHGRTTRKIQYKERGPTSFDWLIYQQLAARYRDDSRVTFTIPDGPDVYYRIYGHRYCLTHGDQFRGGDGLIGPLGPLTRGRHKKASRDASLTGAFDTMVVGHFHQLMQLPHLIVNGTLKGYDEYAFGNNFGFERPSQALWITHPENGITFQMPIYLDDAKHGETGSWVSIPR